MNYESEEIETIETAEAEDPKMGGNMGTYYTTTAVYQGQASYDPIVGLKNGITSEHLDLFFGGLTEGFEHARSAHRTSVNTKMVFVYVTPHKRGNESVWVTDNRVQVERLTPENPAPLFKDYVVSIDEIGRAHV